MIADVKNRRAVFFDFDRTLTSTDTTLVFSFFLLKEEKKIYKYPLVLSLFLTYRLKIISEQSFKNKLCAVLVRNSREEYILNVSNLFFKKYCKKIFIKNITDELTNRANQGWMICIVSSNYDFVLEALNNIFPIDRIISTVTQRKNGFFVGKILGSVCNGREKLLRISNLLREESIKESIGYGDSKGDLEFLQFCDKGFLIKHKNESTIYKVSRFLRMIVGNFKFLKEDNEIEISQVLNH